MAETLEHVSLPEAVGKALRRRILNNELPAETRLVEANLAAEFGVSRGTIRDAMRSLHAEGLIAIVPRRYSVVTRMSPADAEDVCFARYVLEDGSVQAGFGPGRKELARALRVAMQRMSPPRSPMTWMPWWKATPGFMNCSSTFPARRRLKDLWGMLNSQMGALMRAEIERQGIDLSEAVHRHRPIVEAVEEGDLDRLRTELRATI